MFNPYGYYDDDVYQDFDENDSFSDELNTESEYFDNQEGYEEFSESEEELSESTKEKKFLFKQYKKSARYVSYKDEQKFYENLDKLKISNANIEKLSNDLEFFAWFNRHKLASFFITQEELVDSSDFKNLLGSRGFLSDGLYNFFLDENLRKNIDQYPTVPFKSLLSSCCNKKGRADLEKLREKVNQLDLYEKLIDFLINWQVSDKNREQFLDIRQDTHYYIGFYKKENRKVEYFDECNKKLMWRINHQNIIDFIFERIQNNELASLRLEKIFLSFQDFLENAYPNFLNLLTKKDLLAWCEKHKLTLAFQQFSCQINYKLAMSGVFWTNSANHKSFLDKVFHYSHAAFITLDDHLYQYLASPLSEEKIITCSNITPVDLFADYQSEEALSYRSSSDSVKELVSYHQQLINLLKQWNLDEQTIQKFYLALDLKHHKFFLIEMIKHNAVIPIGNEQVFVSFEHFIRNKNEFLFALLTYDEVFSWCQRYNLINLFQQPVDLSLLPEIELNDVLYELLCNKYFRKFIDSHFIAIKDGIGLKTLLSKIKSFPQVARFITEKSIAHILIKNSLQHFLNILFLYEEPNKFYKRFKLENWFEDFQTFKDYYFSAICTPEKISFMERRGNNFFSNERENIGSIDHICLLTNSKALTFCKVNKVFEQLQVGTTANRPYYGPYVPWLIFCYDILHAWLEERIHIKNIWEVFVDDFYGYSRDVEKFKIFKHKFDQILCASTLLDFLILGENPLFTPKECSKIWSLSIKHKTSLQNFAQTFPILLQNLENKNRFFQFLFQFNEINFLSDDSPIGAALIKDIISVDDIYNINQKTLLTYIEEVRNILHRNLQTKRAYK